MVGEKVQKIVKINQQKVYHEGWTSKIFINTDTVLTRRQIIEPITYVQYLESSACLLL